MRLKNISTRISMNSFKSRLKVRICSNEKFSGRTSPESIILGGNVWHSQWQHLRRNARRVLSVTHLPFSGVSLLSQTFCHNIHTFIHSFFHSMGLSLCLSPLALSSSLLSSLSPSPFSPCAVLTEISSIASSDSEIHYL